MATHPVKVVFACILATGLSVIGILRYTTENNAFRLWIPDNSDFVANYNWLEKNSPPDVRFNSMILANQVLIESLKDLDRGFNQEDEHGVLPPAGLAELAAIHKAVAELKTRTSSLTWGDVCLQVGDQVCCSCIIFSRWDFNAKEMNVRSLIFQNVPPNHINRG